MVKKSTTTDMEIGGQREFKGKVYKAVKATDVCLGCGLLLKTGLCCASYNYLGTCSKEFRGDRTGIIFKEVKQA